MTPRVPVKPQLLRWARERAGLAPESLVKRFPKYLAWEAGELRPTHKQLKDFAKFTHVPFGRLLLSKPPHEPFPIPDFRTVGGKAIVRPSPNLLDTVYLCERRQDWYHDYALDEELSRVHLVGSATTTDDVHETAARIGAALKVDLGDRAELSSWTVAMRQFIRHTEEAGILVMVSGIVGFNNHRKLDPDEFRGFALADDLAPLVFVNTADTKAAQMFTLAHEIAHLALGQSALSNIKPNSTTSNQVESWCNRVAAELLVPMVLLREEYRVDEPVAKEFQRLARHFKVRTLVILRRIYDLGVLTDREYRTAYQQELNRFQPLERQSGGNFYATHTLRVSETFARALIINTLEGQTLYRDAFRLLALKKVATFRNLGIHLGVK